MANEIIIAFFLKKAKHGKRNNKLACPRNKSRPFEYYKQTKLKNMKKLLFVWIYLSTMALASADCSDWATSFYPNGQTLSSQGIMVIEGYGQASQVVSQFNTTYPIYLQSAKHKVKLTIKETNKGYGTLQVVLVPAEPLKVGEKYTLVIEKYMPQAEHHTFTKHNYSTQKYEPPTWEITNTVQNTLSWAKKPTETKKHYVEFGCGPSRSVAFSFEVKGSADYLVRVTLTNTAKKTKSTYYILPENTQNVAVQALSIGHSMCSGEFAFGQEVDYTATFDLVDTSGKITAWVGKEVAFKKPTKETRDEE